MYIQENTPWKHKVGQGDNTMAVYILLSLKKEQCNLPSKYGCQNMNRIVILFSIFIQKLFINLFFY